MRPFKVLRDSYPKGTIVGELLDAYDSQVLEIAQLKAELETRNNHYEVQVGLAKLYQKQRDDEREANAKLKDMLREVAFSGTSKWTEHPAISYHEIQVEKSWIKEAQALLGGETS